MRQLRPVPAFDGLWRLCVQRKPGRPDRLIGAGQRNDQVQLRAGFDDPSNAAQDAIDFSERTEAVYVNGHKRTGLRESSLRRS
jgi:hypothetical protein